MRVLVLGGTGFVGSAVVAEATPSYVYVSSKSVYQLPIALGADEQAPIVAAEPDADGGTYPQLKAGGERAVTAIFGNHALLAQAGLILGPVEDIGRLPWWLHRIARGGQVLAPGPVNLPLQYIDSRSGCSTRVRRAPAAPTTPSAPQDIQPWANY